MSDFHCNVGRMAIEAVNDVMRRDREGKSERDSEERIGSRGQTEVGWGWALILCVQHSALLLCCDPSSTVTVGLRYGTAKAPPMPSRQLSPSMGEPKHGRTSPS